MVKDFFSRNRSSSSTKTQTLQHEDVYAKLSGGGICPICRMPFDKGKKRKLIDNCGHERCYSCLFKSESCPICAAQGPPKAIQTTRSTLGPGSPPPRSHVYTNGSSQEIQYPRSTLAPGSPPPRSQVYTNGVSNAIQSPRTTMGPCSPPPPRSQVYTNGTFTSGRWGGMASCDPGLPPEPRASLSRSVSPRRLLHPSTPHSSLYANTAQPYISPPITNGPINGSIYSPVGGGRETPLIGGRDSPRMGGGETPIIGTPPTVPRFLPSSPQPPKSVGGTPSNVRRRGLCGRGPGGSLSPWSRRQARPNTVNIHSAQQLTDLLPLAEKKSSQSMSFLRRIKSMWSIDDECETESNVTAPPALAPARGATETNCIEGSEDLYMRLGLLLGDGAAPPSGVAVAPVRAVHHPDHRAASSHTSYSSLSAASDGHTNLSSNTSPVSTLTGSSEAELRDPVGHRDPSLENMSDLMAQALRSDSPCGTSNSSASPKTSPRRHSVTTSAPGQVEELGLFGNRRSSVRRSARNAQVKGPIDPKVRFANYRGAQLSLRPLFFEVPQQDPDPLFVGRAWLFREIESQLTSDGQTLSPSNRGVVITGNIGTGKTAAALQLVEYSCFGRKRDDSLYQDSGVRGLVPEGVRGLASRVVAYHFCQADNAVTCLVPELVHSLAAQLCQAPQLSAFHTLLLTQPQTQALLAMSQCITDPDTALIKGVLEPLANLRRLGKVGPEPLVVVIDGLCEAEYHRPDHSDTIASFLAKHHNKFPTFLKLIVTVRSQLCDLARTLSFHHVTLDPDSRADPNIDPIARDLVDYVAFRSKHSPTIKTNITVTHGKMEGGISSQQRFTNHIISKCQGSLLFLKLILDLIERGHLVMKSSSFKVLPHTLNEIFHLLFNLRFPSGNSFEKVSAILNVVLAALTPLTLPEIYHSVNAGLLYKFLSWDEFLSKFKLLNSFLVKRLDDTYMLFHPAIREWLARRLEGESSKFVCDIRLGHAALALRMSRLEWPLDGEATLELGHHILKAHVYRNMARALPLSPRDLQALWLAQSAHNVSQALATTRNLYSPNTKVSRLLLLAGASPDSLSDHMHSCPIIGVCASLGHTDMVALLIEFGADVNQTNTQGMSALNLASAHGQCEVVRLLVAAQASLTTTDCFNHSPMVLAAQQGYLNVVGYLQSCDWPGPAEVLRNVSYQALVAASANGHSNVVEFLLDMSDVSINGSDNVTGETALTAAAGAGHTALIASLLRMGAAINKSNSRNCSPLTCSVRSGHYEVAKLLLGQGVDVESPDGHGRTPLMVSAAEGHLGLMELLISRGASITRTDREGLSPLSWACLKGHIHAVQYLVDCNANLNLPDKSGRTPLDLAAYQGDPTVVQFLLERGAVIEHVDINGMRPLDRAISARNAAAVQCFLRRGAKLGPATWAMAAGKPNIMIILLNKLQEDGVALCRKGRLKEAAHRFSYAIRKLPTGDQGENSSTFTQLQLHLTLNLSRCKRKMNEIDEAIKLADDALNLKSDSYEAYYARARAKREAKLLESAVNDVNEAVRLAPATREVRRVLIKIRDEMQSELDTHAASDLTALKQLAASVDTLSEAGCMTSSLLSESGYSSNV
ncbi:unnamed protein product [Meganyctiphanes norvegica]|uniref:RING-type domain-containing protein n=1 Tax=Meganyctiphanes norvegica TaxID=48144 RepID=A0AAV2R610_MEGNR